MHYEVYFFNPQTPEQLVNVNTTATTYLVSVISDLLSSSCNLSMQVSAVNAHGEGQKSTIIETDGKESHEQQLISNNVIVVSQKLMIHNKHLIKASGSDSGRF